MTAVNFAYWMQGFFEISGNSSLNNEQVKIIKNHLNMVFIHDIDPKMGDAKHQQVLNELHNGASLGDSFPFDNGNIPKFNTIANTTELMRC